MSAHYSAHNERLSFGIKLKLIKACKLAAKKHGRIQSLETAWIFVLGRSTSIRANNAEAPDKARDVSVVIPTEKFKVVLPASFCPKDIPKNRPDLSLEQDDDPVSDEASFLDDSEAGEADEEHIFNLLTLARSTVLACGSFATSKVHLL